MGRRDFPLPLLHSFPIPCNTFLCCFSPFTFSLSFASYIPLFFPFFFFLCFSLFSSTILKFQVRGQRGNMICIEDRVTDVLSLILAPMSLERQQYILCISYICTCMLYKLCIHRHICIHLSTNL